MTAGFRVLAVAVLCLAAWPAWASDYAFRLHNRSNGWVINGFYTYQNGQWSANWLKRGMRIRPGGYADMDWYSNEGNCVVPFRVSWDDYGAEDFTLDWCKDVDNIYMLDQGFRWD